MGVVTSVHRMGQSTPALTTVLCLWPQEATEVQQLREDCAGLQSECDTLRDAVEEKEEMVRQLKADILRLDYKTETERV